MNKVQRAWTKDSRRIEMKKRGRKKERGGKL